MGVSQPAPVPARFNGPQIAEVKVMSKDVRYHYKQGHCGRRAVESRAAEIPTEYRRKAKKM